MDIKRVQENLEWIYLDYFDGLYSEKQLKLMLLKLYKKTNLTDKVWSELILAAQWRHASEEDYELKKLQLRAEYKEDD
ncbi:hypothetical protein BKP37_15780 [Anaerobacillus alkalilacustris]|uniref:Uncharacterized protein n=1 Tax=Anaerobacillus alkalilacustris TaxID=393763 RepID=A0A1S2LIN1_9BACI|nr:hypothetical protein [Anaerobacillus alkalilacustris]OIJ11335.1 hypothetical protein BKP37_15780 [Anaerobacillus alkalilacustris]